MKPNDEVAVLIAAINAQSVKSGDTLALLVSQTELGTLDTIPADTPARKDWIKKVFFRRKQPSLDTFADFVGKNTAPTTVSPAASFAIPHAMISKKDWWAILERDNRKEELARRFPGSKGAITVSRPGFNKEHTQALICIGREVVGEYVLFEKAHGKWREIARTMAWIV